MKSTRNREIGDKFVGDNFILYPDQMSIDYDTRCWLFLRCSMVESKWGHIRAVANIFQRVKQRGEINLASCYDVQGHLPTIA